MPKRLALLIGNAQFEDIEAFPALRTPPADAADFTDVLKREGGFEILGTLVDQGWQVVREAIDELYHCTARGDLTLLYYAGHGFRARDGKLYLAASNTKTSRILATGIQEDFLRDTMHLSLCQHRIVILDCCFSGALVQNVMSAAQQPLLLEELKGAATAILASSSSIQFSFEEEGRNSLFTCHLLEGIKTGAGDMDNDGMIGAEELFDYAAAQVKSQRPEQTPMKAFSARDANLLIARNPKPLQVRLPDEMQAAIENPFAGVRVGVITELVRWGRTGGLPKELAARRALEKLAEDDSRQVSHAARSALELLNNGRVEKTENVPPQKQATFPDGAQKPPILLKLVEGVSMEVLHVPAGDFWMGSDVSIDPDADADERPYHLLRLDEFWIGKTPVTVAQFAAFINASGYQTAAEKKGESWVLRKDKKGWETVKGASWYRPNGLESNVRLKQNHPVTHISWYDALEFCEWLSKKSGKKVGLPSEAEWEKAARGVAGHIYPWGDEPPGKNLLNCSMQFGDTTEVGKYPAGASPYGLLDMAGNVWEWTRSLWGKDTAKPEFKYPYLLDGRENLKAPDSIFRVVRGGSFWSELKQVRCAYRDGNGPDFHLDYFGFRVFLSPHSS